MKVKRFAVLIFGILIFGVPQALSQSLPKSTSRVNVKYDKGKDLTTITLKRTTITSVTQEKATASNLPLHQMDLDVAFSYRGQKALDPVTDVVMTFHCVAGTYIFLKGQEVIAAIDRAVAGKDRGFNLGMTKYSSSPPKFNSVYEENMEITIPVDALRKFADAKSLELYLGPISYELTQKQMDGIKEFAGFLPITGTNGK